MAIGAGQSGPAAAHAPGDGQLTARAVIPASGTFGHPRPYRPGLPALDSHPGTLLHAADYRTPETFTGQRVAAVGTGNIPRFGSPPSSPGERR
ncbi:hypothetical protein [Streptomyces violaceus]|uniref:Uncharacterized protein n=1 Tax=Streptomyces violaceus TaxID=1936 RepID=A0ABZ1NX11_STRVL